MARPRTITDERLIEAVGDVMAHRGPGFTVADVAERAGVSVGTVAGRFGSKHGLLKAASMAAIDASLRRIRAAADAADSPLAGLRDALVGVYASVDDPSSTARNLAGLAADLVDEELRAVLAEHYAAVERELVALVRAARSALPGAPQSEQAARLLFSLVNGTTLNWSVRNGGSLVARLAEDIDAVLDGWRRTGEEFE